MKKRLGIWLIVVLGLAVGLAGCAKATGTTDKEQTTPTKDIKIMDQDSQKFDDNTLIKGNNTAK